jgi:hypothetical protein
MFEYCKIHLEALSRFFHQWRLRPNPSKTEVCVFHLPTHDANKKLKVKFDNTIITHVDCPEYLGVTLDRTLTNKPHLEKSAMKVNARVNLVRRPAGTKWRSGACLALVYSAAEHCAPVWLNSVHVNKIDV